MADNSQDPYSELQVVLKDSRKHAAGLYPDVNGKAKVFIGDKDGNLLTEKIILNNGLKNQSLEIYWSG